MSSRLVVLGSCGAWPEPGRACSGFVLEHQGFRVVLDLGYGALPRLLSHLGSTVADGVDAVVVTHAHPDHMVDLHGLFRARWFGARWFGARWFGRRSAPPVPLYAPEQVVTRLESLEEDDDDAVRAVFDWHPLPAEAYRVGPFTLSSVALPHWVLNAGVRLEAPGLTVAYTGDTGPDAALSELGRDADLFVVEATDRHQTGDVPLPEARQQMHLSARGAGEAAAAARARRLLLTHFWPGNDRERSRRSAEQVFPGEVLVADEGLEIPLP